jgi:hypothetical protein
MSKSRNPVYEFFRRISIAVFTPVVFSYRKGHFRSAIKSRAVDRDGAALPWFSYPIIDFLRSRNLAGKRVLEFGAGQSTIWWKSVGAEVTSLEVDKKWYHYIQQQVAGCEIYLTDKKFTNIPDSVLGRRFDIIVVDGGIRLYAIKIAVELVEDSGIIILDDSTEEATPHYLEAPKLMYNHGWKRVDFYGFAPGAIREGCTSLYWKSDGFFATPEPPPISADRVF